MASPELALPDELGPRGLRDEYEDRITGATLGLVADRLEHYLGSIEDLDGSAWADKYRFMGVGSNYQRWSTDRTPYLREIAAALSSRDPAYQVIVVSKAAQLGMTEVLLNDALRRIHLEPCPMLFYTETDQKAGAWMRTRLEPALRQEPFARNSSITFNDKELHFPGGFLQLFGAQSPNAMAGTTARVIYGDEVARYPESVGKEGDFLSLVSQRVATYGPAAKIILSSTPLEQRRGEGTFYSAFMMGDCREYLVPCRHCGEMVLWEMDQVVKVDMGRGAENAYGIKCPNCEGVTLDGAEREEAIQAGRWTPTKPGLPGFVSFRISGLVMPPDWRPLEKLYSRYEVANQGGRSLQAFHNLELGEFFDEPEMRQPGASEAARRMTQPQYRQGNVPDDCAVLTMAVDVQKDHLQWEIKGWTPDRLENWSIDRGTLQVQIDSTAQVVRDLREIINRDYPREDGRVMRVWLTGIDEGYKAAAVHQVQMAFPQPIIEHHVQRIPRGCVVATKGARLIEADKLILAVPGGKTAKGQRRKLKFFRIGTDIAKRELYVNLRAPLDSEQDFFGKPHAPEDYPEDYYEELTAEEIVSVEEPHTKKIRQAFRCPPRKANEALDLHVINRALIDILGAPEWSAKQWSAAKEQECRKKEVKLDSRTPEQRKAARRVARREQREKARAARARIKRGAGPDSGG